MSCRRPPTSKPSNRPSPTSRDGRCSANDMVLWFFSFAKYLMYRDLDPGNWPEHAPLENNPTLSALLQDGFPSEPPLFGDDEKIDPLIAPQQMIHVTDADSSQAVVIEEVRRGRSLVVQGPPGTGKSQTITNIIATAVKEGKKVLFVAEKMAALEVVYSRLERLGLGVICLELHSRKANKKAVLEEINGTLKLGRPKVNGSTEQIEALGRIRDQLNRHASLLNTPLEPAGVTIFQIFGRLAGLNELRTRDDRFRAGRPELVDQDRVPRQAPGPRRLADPPEGDRTAERTSLVGRGA